MLPEEQSDSDENVEQTVEDDDICSSAELEAIFKHRMTISSQYSVAVDQAYVLKLALDSTETRIAAGISNNTVLLYDFNSSRGLTKIQAPYFHINDKDFICGLRFLDDSPNTLIVGSSKGVLQFFDLRTLKAEGQMVNSMPCDFLSFDRNSESRIVCAGTNKFKESAYLMFYDVRKFLDMGGYCDSHSDDVTSVLFHPSCPDKMCSGSTDGLINLYNLKEADEEDALEETCNTESTVEKLQWHTNGEGKLLISCITSTDGIKICDSSDCSEIASFDIESITKSFRRKSSANCNIINVHSTADGGMLMLGGTYETKRSVLRSVLVQDEKLVPVADFPENNQIVRDSILQKSTGTLITGGERGFITLWETAKLDAPTASSSLKMKTKHTNKRNPY